MKYMTRIGQYTGMLKKSKNVHTKAMTVAFVAEYQNLNSGSLLTNGRNSSFCLVGNAMPSSSAASSAASDSAIAGSIFGVKNASSKFR